MFAGTAVTRRDLAIIMWIRNLHVVRVRNFEGSTVVGHKSVRRLTGALCQISLISHITVRKGKKTLLYETSTQAP